MQDRDQYGKNRRRGPEARETRLPTTGYREKYYGFMRTFESVREENLYLYVSSSIGVKRDAYSGLLLPDFMSLYYRSAIPAAERFYMACDRLLHEAGTLVNSDDIQVPDLIRASRVIFHESASLVQSFNTIDETPITNFKGLQSLDARSQREFAEFRDRQGSDKPKAIRHMMRRHIPFWMWLAMAGFEQEIDEEALPLLRSAWSRASQTDMHLLIDENNLASGYLPFHKLYGVADEIEQNGAYDAGYDLKTSAINTLLLMEKQNINPEPNSSCIPFFTYAFAGAMTGETGFRSQNDFFDYHAAIDTIMRQTFIRVGDEFAAGREGYGLKFLQDLSEYYPDHFPELLAMSMSHHASSSGGFDEIEILRGLSERNIPWGEQVAEKMRTVRGSRVLFADEVESIAEGVKELGKGVDIAPAQAIANAQTLLGEDDIVSHRALTQGAIWIGEVNLDLEAASEYINVVLSGQFGRSVRAVPFRISFTGERESFHMGLLSDEPLREETVETLRTFVLGVVQRTAESKREDQKILQLHPAKPTLEIAGLDREGRKAAYERDKAALQGEKEPKVKQTRAAAAQDTPTQETEQSERRTNVRVSRSSLSRKKVEDLLSACRLGASYYEQVRDIILRAEATAAVNGGRFGTRVSDDFTGPAIKINQLNWSFNSGRIQVRLYFQDRGNNYYKLVGIMHKQSGWHGQRDYIQQLVSRIDNE